MAKKKETATRTRYCRECAYAYEPHGKSFEGQAFMIHCSNFPEYLNDHTDYTKYYKFLSDTACLHFRERLKSL